MVARQRVPAEAGLGLELVERLEQVQQADVDQVADADAERDAGGVQQLGDRAPGHVVDLLVVADLGVAEDDGGELVGLGLPPQREVDRRRQRPGRVGPLVEPGRGQAIGPGHVRREVPGRPPGAVDVVEPGQVLPAQRCGPARRFDDEQDVAVADAEAVPAGGVGADEVAAVGHEHAGQTPGGRASDAGAVGVVEDHPGGDLLSRAAVQPRRHRRQRGQQYNADAGRHGRAEQGTSGNHLAHFSPSFQRSPGRGGRHGELPVGPSGCRARVTVDRGRALSP